MDSAFKGSPYSDESFKTDEYGITMTGYAPIKDNSGKVVAIIGVDVDVSYINEQNKQILTNIGIILGNLFIKISNPYSGVIAFDGGLPVTKKENPVMHGIGIKSIQELVKEQSGYCKITTINNIFCVEIMLYDFVK